MGTGRHSTDGRDTVAIESRQRPARREGGAGVSDGARAVATAAMGGREKGKKSE